MSLRKYTIRSMQQRPGRTVLTLLSIVIGVGAVVSIGLGTATTRNAYKQLFEMVTGKANLEIDASGGVGFSLKLFPEVAKVPGVLAAAPVVERQTSMSLGEDRRVRLQLLGIDPALDAQVRDVEISAGRMVEKGQNEVVLDESFATFLELKVGDDVRLLTNRITKTFKIVGVLRPKSGVGVAKTALAFMPIDRAQLYFNRRGREDIIDKIQVVAAPSDAVDEVRLRIAAILPENVQVHKPESGTQLMRETLLSTEQGLRFATVFTIVMAAFIILNTFLMNVSERRRHLSIMRAVGGTRWQIGWSLFGEALLLGFVGTLIGIVAGVIVAFLATYIVANSFQVELPALRETMTARPFVMGALFGLLMSIVGGILPSVMAARISPLEGMNRVVPARSRGFAALFFGGGLLLVIVSAGGIGAAILGHLPIEAATYFGVGFLVGVVLLDIVLLDPQATLVAWLLKPFRRVEANLALKQVLRNRMRSALTVAVVFMAGSVGLGIANSILDCVQDVYDWTEVALRADFYLRAMMPDMATGTAPDLPDELGPDLEKLPHLSFEAASFIQGQVPPPAGTQDEEAMRVIVIARSFKANENLPFDLISGDLAKIGAAMQAGEVVIGSVLAQKKNIHLGDKLALETTDGTKELTVCGIANEYLVGGLAVHMQRQFAEKLLGIHGVDGYLIDVEDGYAATMRPELEKLARKYDVFLLSQTDIKRNIRTFVRAVQWSLWVLVVLGFVVAAFGLVNTLTMNVLEQTRELGLLRIVAMTKDQVRRVIVTQAIIIAVVGLPKGVAMGTLVAYVLNLAMQPSFGRPIDFHMYPWLIVGTLVGALVIVLVAAILPALRATRINVVEALHYE
ncbi:MAG: FtsX-like permease family protein [Pirellulaceae bacterium]|nr:FtsX-like permease family protein [Pirellulaceae bacterium]